MTNCQFWNHNTQTTDQVQNEQIQVIVGIVSRYQKQANWHKHQKLLCWSVLISIIDLFPHGQIIKRTSIELERRTFNLVEHDVRADIIRQVGQRPFPIIIDYADEIERKFQKHNYNDMNDPCPFKVHPIGIHRWIQ
jgi:hypothetical protein